MISYSDPSKNVADPPSMAELLEVLEPMRIERERRQAIRDGTAPVSPSLSWPPSLMTSPVAVETASTVANLVTSPLTVPRRRSQGEVVVGVHATNVARMVISQGIVLPSLLVAVGTASTAGSLAISVQIVWRRRNPGEVVVAVEPVMDVEKKVISRETVLRRSAVEEVVVVDVSIVVRRVISYVSNHFPGYLADSSRESA